MGAGDSDPFLALGMVSAPWNFERRKVVRRDMLDLPSVRDGSLVFRFLLGRVAGNMWPSGKDADAYQAEIADRAAYALRLDTLDGPAPNKQCSCLEKAAGWFEYAQRMWPRAAFYGKTEDDAYVNLRLLELELRRLRSDGRQLVLYGAINVCAMPALPRPRVGYQGAWLGRLENFRTAEDAHHAITNKLGKVRGPSGVLGSPAPFATGDLMVMDSLLTRALFGRCAYLAGFVKAGRQANRQSGCRATGGAGFASSWATLTCDCAFGSLLSECSKELDMRPTIAHMTYTKSHNYNEAAGFTSATAPSRLSIVVHALKMPDHVRSGPNRSRGGEWRHVHMTASYWRQRNEDDPGFPPLLWQYNAAAAPGAPSLTPIDARRQEWYAQACHPRRTTLKRRTTTLVASVKGPKQKGWTEAEFLGGQVAHWTGHGCHPSRGYAYPRWPEPVDPLNSSFDPAVDYVVSARGPGMGTSSRTGGSLAFDWRTPVGRLGS